MSIWDLVQTFFVTERAMQCVSAPLACVIYIHELIIIFTQHVPNPWFWQSILHSFCFSFSTKFFLLKSHLLWLQSPLFLVDSCFIASIQSAKDHSGLKTVPTLSVLISLRARAVTGHKYSLCLLMLDLFSNKVSFTARPRLADRDTAKERYWGCKAGSPRTVYPNSCRWETN